MLSGEVRTGSEDADKWIIQDDGHGFPCFYNVETEVVKHDDPRFVEQVAEDLANQRDWVMQGKKKVVEIANVAVPNTTNIFQ
jgi:hypothetical protein